MAQRQKRNRTAWRLTPEDAQLGARMICECPAEDGIGQTDAIGVFVYGIAQTLKAMQMEPNERDPTLSSRACLRTWRGGRAWPCGLSVNRQ
jgi:hypothetical protein